MKQLVYDYQRLREAIVLVLDPRYGPSREQRVREAIAKLPHNRQFFWKAIEPLNEIVAVARQSPTKAQDILDMASRKRGQLQAQREKATPLDTKRRAHLRENTRNYRARLDNALKTEELRRQRRLTREEATAFLDEKRKLWKMRVEQFLQDHPEMKPAQARSVCTAQINKEVQERYERAVASGAIKRPSTTSRDGLSRDKIRNLERKFNNR